MSRGPGLVMRAALALLAEDGSTSAYIVVLRARHERSGCHEDRCWADGGCDGWRTPQPTRSELVGARRALHKLADRGLAELYHKRGDPYTSAPPLLFARVCVANGVSCRRRQHIAKADGTAAVSAANPASSPLRQHITSNGDPRLITPREIGIRETDRCDSCARLFSEVDYAGTEYAGSSKRTKRVRGLALCRDCQDGLTDPVALVSGGQFAIDRMKPIPCGECGGELSVAGLRRIYVDGATLPLCDECHDEHTRARLARAGFDLDAIKRQMTGEPE